MQRFIFTVVLLLALLAVNVAGGAQPSQIFFTSLDHNRETIFTVRPDGTGMRQISDNAPFNSFLAAISADGSKATYSADTVQGTQIFVVNIDGTNRKQLMNVDGSNPHDLLPPEVDGWSPSWGNASMK